MIARRRRGKGEKEVGKKGSRVRKRRGRGERGKNKISEEREED